MRRTSHSSATSRRAAAVTSRAATPRHEAAPTSTCCTPTCAAADPGHLGTGGQDPGQPRLHRYGGHPHRRIGLRREGRAGPASPRPRQRAPRFGRSTAAARARVKNCLRAGSTIRRPGGNSSATAAVRQVRRGRRSVVASRQGQRQGVCTRGPHAETVRLPARNRPAACRHRARRRRTRRDRSAVACASTAALIHRCAQARACARRGSATTSAMVAGTTSASSPPSTSGPAPAPATGRPQRQTVRRADRVRCGDYWRRIATPADRHPPGRAQGRRVARQERGS